MNLELWQMVKSGSDDVVFELLRNGTLLATRTLHVETDAELLKQARDASMEEHRKSIENRSQIEFYIASRFDPFIDRSAETQAMVKAVAEVLFPDLIAHYT